LCPADGKKSRPPLRQYEIYSEAIDFSPDLINEVADASNLKLDPRADTDYLADAMVITTPNIMETLGKMRD